MPNWCDNVERIAGPKEQVKFLCDRLNEWIHNDYYPNSFSNGWLGNIVGHSGIEEDGVPDHWKHRCRGELVDGFEYEENGDEGVIKFSTMTAWEPFPNTWYTVLKKWAPAAKYYYICSEPDMCVFESNDINHKFFNHEFVVSYGFHEKDKLPEIYLTELDDSEYGMDWDWDPDEVIGMMERITGITMHDYNDDGELKLLLEAFDRKTEQDLDGDNYINVYKIEYYDPEKELL